jgi:hypothetical protein
MKQITMDYQTYELELKQAKLEGIEETTRKFEKQISALYGLDLKEFHKRYHDYEEAKFKAEMILYGRTHRGFVDDSNL